MTSIRKRFIHSARWSMLASVGERVLSAIATIIIARILSVENFGKYGLIKNTIDMFNTYAVFRLGSTATKYVAEYRVSNKEKAAKILKLVLLTSLLFCLLASILLFQLAPLIAQKRLHDASLKESLLIGAFLLFFTAFSSVRQTALTGFEDFRSVAFASIIRGCLTIVFCIPSTYVWGINGTLGSLAFVAFCHSVVIGVSLRKNIELNKFKKNIRFKEIKSELGVLGSFALPGVLLGVLNITAIWLGKTTLAQQENGYLSLGIFEAANQWRTMVLFFPAMLSRVALPLLSATQHGTKDFFEVISLQLKSNNLVTLPLTIFVIGMSPLLIMIFGSEFQRAESLMPLMIVSVYLFSYNQSLRRVFDGTGSVWKNLCMYLIWSIVFYFVARLAIPQLKAVGLVYAYLISEIVLFIIQGTYVDLFICKGVIRSHSVMFGASMLLVIASLIVGQMDQLIIRYAISIILMCVASWPILRLIPQTMK